MAVNNKLTHAIKDRVVQKFELNGSELLISFVDGSKMTVTIADCNSPPLQEGCQNSQISEDQAKLLFECEDDSTLDVTIVAGELCDCWGREQSGRVSGIICESGFRQFILLHQYRVSSY